MKRKPISLYDRRRIPIREGDLLKMNHFSTKRRKYYMYKMVTITSDGFLRGVHHPFKELHSDFDLQAGASKDTGIIDDVEVVCGLHPHGEDFSDRPRRSK